jgi:hypothetical protein
MVKLSSNALKSELWDSLQALKSKKIDAETANAIASQSREIMRIVKIEIDISRLQGRKPSQKLIGNL